LSGTQRAAEKQGKEETGTMKRYTLKGINDDETTCAVCGKVELKQVMWLAELNEEGEEIGDAFHCGTTCGAKLMKRGISKVRTAVKSFGAKKKLHLWKISDSYRRDEKRAILNQLNDMNLWGNERYDHPLMSEYKAIEAEGKEWAAQQPFSLEI
jgi:hypothetical protein